MRKVLFLTMVLSWLSAFGCASSQSTKLPHFLPALTPSSEIILLEGQEVEIKGQKIDLRGFREELRQAGVDESKLQLVDYHDGSYAFVLEVGKRTFGAGIWVKVRKWIPRELKVSDFQQLAGWLRRQSRR